MGRLPLVRYQGVLTSPARWHLKLILVSVIPLKDRLRTLGPLRFLCLVSWHPSGGWMGERTHVLPSEAFPAFIWFPEGLRRLTVLWEWKESAPQPALGIPASGAALIKQRPGLREGWRGGPEQTKQENAHPSLGEQLWSRFLSLSGPLTYYPRNRVCNP